MGIFAGVGGLIVLSTTGTEILDKVAREGLTEMTFQ